MALYSTVHCQYKWTHGILWTFWLILFCLGTFFLPCWPSACIFYFLILCFMNFICFSCVFLFFLLLYLLLLFVCCLLSQKRKRKKSHGVEWVRRIWEDENRKVRSEYIEWKTFFPEKQTNEQESYQCLRF